MSLRWEVVTTIAGQHVIGIVRARDAATGIVTARALHRAGLGAVEISLTTPGALGAIEELAAEGGLLGAGTVLDAASAIAAVRAGARFLVSPVLAPDVIAAGLRYGAAIVAAAQTASEALRALELGADLVKLFPASAWSPRMVADLLQALPQLPLVPTGGIALADAPAWIEAGAVAVGLGSALVPGAVDELLSALTVYACESKSFRS
jgi:2-dehydro-3-deoxyphosphogluconate aldolase/(4S)-4-hydroxy-2-oxoglutarate aldolase